MDKLLEPIIPTDEEKAKTKILQYVNAQSARLVLESLYAMGMPDENTKQALEINKSWIQSIKLWR